MSKVKDSINNIIEITIDKRDILFHISLLLIRSREKYGSDIAIIKVERKISNIA